MNSRAPVAEVLLTVEQAAAAAHVTRRAVQSWIDRGLLTRLGVDERERTVVRKLDVLLVERATRRAPRAAALLAAARAELGAQRPASESPQDHAIRQGT